MNPERYGGLSNDQIDERISPLKAGLRRLQEGAREFDELIELYEEKIAIIEGEREAAERQAAEARSRALAAEGAEAEASAKYKQALALKEGKFEELIEELFAAPSRDLRESIEISAHRSNMLTQKTALFSILLTVAVAIISLVLGSLQGREIHSRLERATSTLSSLSGDVPGLKKGIDGFGSRFSSLDSRFSEVGSQLTKLSSSVQELGDKNRKITFSWRSLETTLADKACVARGRDILREGGLADVSETTRSAYGRKNSALALIHCLGSDKVMIIGVYGPEEEDLSELGDRLAVLWRNRTTK